jgi:cell shape-determining protein MreC
MGKKTILSLMVLGFAALAWGASDSEQMKSVDQEIKQLKAKIKQLELEEMREDVDNQGRMIAEWGKYGQELEKIKTNEESQKQLHHQLETLEQQKAQLQNGAPPKSQL